MTSRSRTDETLVQEMAAGDAEAFAAIYRRYNAPVYRFARQMTGSDAVSQDVVQEVFMALLDRPAAYDPARGELRTFLFGIARHHVLRRIRREPRSVPLPAAGETDAALPDQLIDRADPASDLARAQLIETLRRAVLALPPHYREAVVLCDLQALSYRDAAAVVGCRVGTIRSRLNRARALLRRKLQARAAAADAVRRRCFA
jgi:RNA polymerase sigma-70 factor (ECF subfamily)